MRESIRKFSIKIAHRLKTIKSAEKLLLLFSWLQRNYLTHHLAFQLNYSLELRGKCFSICRGHCFIMKLRNCRKNRGISINWLNFAFMWLLSQLRNKLNNFIVKPKIPLITPQFAIQFFLIQFSIELIC